MFVQVLWLCDKIPLIKHNNKTDENNTEAQIAHMHNINYTNDYNFFFNITTIFAINYI